MQKKVTERKKLPRGRCLKGKCVFLRKKKAPAGTLVAKPDFLRKKKAPAGTLVAKPGFFKKKKSPCGHAGGDSGFLRKKKPLRARWWRFQDFKKKTPTRQRPRGNAHAATPNLIKETPKIPSLLSADAGIYGTI